MDHLRRLHVTETVVAVKESTDMRLHTGKDLNTCSTCGYVSAEPWKFKRHMRCHGEKTYKCPTCKRRFARKDNLLSHMRTHTEVKPHVCGICGKTFRRASDLRRHLYLHGRNNIHKCHSCSKSFIRATDLRDHISIHLREGSNKCPVCGKSFKKPAHFHAHVRIHFGEKPHGCQLCGKRFTGPSDLRRHSLIHTGQKNLGERNLCKRERKTRVRVPNNFTCDICANRFYRFSDLVKHIKGHAISGTDDHANSEIKGQAGEKVHRPKTENSVNNQRNPISYCCDICGLNFSRCFNLKRHIGTHFRKKLDKPVNMETNNVMMPKCVKTSANSPADILKRHILTHIGKRLDKLANKEINNIMTPKCVRTSDAIPADSGIKQKEYYCDTCSRIFSRFSSLQNHIISHTNLDTTMSFNTEVKLPKLQSVNHRIDRHTDDRTGVVVSSIKPKESYKQTHISHQQTDFKNYSCRTCDKSFTKGSSLRNHMVVHTKTGIYKCDICGIDNKGFSSLQKHIVTHLEQKGHYCCICSSEFSRESQLLDHMLVHTWENAPSLPFLE